MINTRIVNGRVFSTVTFLFLCAILTIAASLLNQKSEQVASLHWVVTAMYFYLLVVFTRTGGHLLFSFLWYFFKRPQHNKLKSHPLVSIIIPCYQEERVIEQAVQSALAIDYPNYEIIVVDDGSADLTFENSYRFHHNKRVRVLVQKNEGKAAALNKGISEALGEYILCVDADSQLNQNVLYAGMKYFLDNPNMGAVAGKVLVGNKKTVLTSFQKLEYITALNFLKVAQSFLSSVTVVPGPVGLFRKSAILDVGGYKRESFAEDCDLTLRLLTHGYGVVYEPNMVATTEAPEEFFSLIKQRYRWSRGIVQAIKLNSKWLMQPISQTRNFFIILYMVLESIFIPTCNYLFAMAAVILALSDQNFQVVGHFFMQLVLLDAIVAFYSLLSERFSFRVLVLALVSRFTYGLALEMQRFFAIFEELLELPMSWGKLERKGLK